MGCSGNGSAIAAVKMRVGKTWPALRVQLLGKSGAPVDLTNAASVTFHAKRDHTGLEITGTCEIVGDAKEGFVEYQWVDGDTDVAGWYVFWFDLVFAGGATGVVPECVGDRAFLLEVCPAP